MFGLVLAVLLFPLGAFLILLLVPRRVASFGPYLAISAMSFSFLSTLGLFFLVLSGKSFEVSFVWFKVGQFSFEGGFLIDSLSVLMLLLVATVSLLVEIYSLGYMEQKRKNWFFAALSLFALAMLGLILSSSYLQLFLFWELVGLASFLLIGFWFEREDASRAAKKAFLTTRLGDIGFLLALIIIFTTFGTFNMGQVFEKASFFGSPLLTLITLLLFAGAVGKSAQFPLHVWLPDAMAGPTPVSALIHAATMVAAGVYLIARSYPLFSLSPVTLTVVAYLGAFTAFLAATMAMATEDIKKILPFSTISQLGYMMVGLGVGAYAAGIFHLVTHAFFKALLFLGAGSLIHMLHLQEVWEIGKVYHRMKVTAITFIIGGLALAGFPPFSGFWSKDAILTAAFNSNDKGPFYLIFFTVFLTSFYIFRLIFLGFFEGKEEEKAKEAPLSMTIPMIILAVFSVSVGFLGAPFLGEQVFRFLGEHPASPNYALMAFSLILTFLGFFLAYGLYYPQGKVLFAGLKGKFVAEPPPFLLAVFKFTRQLAANRYFLDEIYQATLVRPAHRLSEVLRKFDRRVIDEATSLVAQTTLALAKGAQALDLLIDRLVDYLGKGQLGLSYTVGGFSPKALGGLREARFFSRFPRITSGFDLGVIDGIVNALGILVRGLGRRLRKIQTGNLLNYGLIMFLTLLILIILFIFLRHPLLGDFLR